MNAFSGVRNSPTGYLMRYGLLGYALLAVVVVSIVVMTLRGAPWRGDIVWTIDWLPVAHVVAGPVLAGAAAVDTARMTGTHLWLYSWRAWRSPGAFVVFGYASGIAVVHGLISGAALLMSAPLVWDWGALLAIAVHIVVLILFAAVGGVLGRFLSTGLAGIVGAVAGFGLVTLFEHPISSWFHVFETGIASVPRVGYTYHHAFLVAQLIGGLLMVGGSLWLQPHRVHGQRLPHVKRAAVPLIVIALALSVSALGPDERLLPSIRPPTSCGTMAALTDVCLYTEHRRVAEVFSNEVWVLVTTAEDAGYHDLIPPRVEEVSHGYQPDLSVNGALYISGDHLGGAKPIISEVALGIVQPRHCPQLSREEPPSEQYWSDLDALVGTWVALVDPTAAELEVAYVDEPLEPAAAAAILKQFRTCTHPF